MKKKILALCLVVVLAVTAITGVTLAYFTDTEQKTNTMTIGNVEINIDEFQKVDGEWEDFENNDFTLYPVDSSVGITYRNKVAYTANVSPSEDDAYIRTIVLFEVNDLLEDTYEGQADCCVPGLHFNYYNGETAESVINGKTIHATKATFDGTKVTIDGNDYWVVVFEDAKGEAIPYDEAQFSLNGVFMDKNITSEQITGWGNEVDIIVFSQGIQATDLSYDDAMTALGTVDQTNLTNWLEGNTEKNIEAAPEATINDWE